MQAMEPKQMSNLKDLKRGRRTLRALALGTALVLALIGADPHRAMANPFEPVVSVNGRVITQYELDQRVLFLEILRQDGDLPSMARSSLIEDRLRMFAAKDAGIGVTPEQVMAGMAEFASRANLSAEEFIELTGQMGLSAETFRDFVEAGIVWREVVRAKYATQVTITEAEIDRAIASFQPTGVLKLQLAEIVLPGSNGDLSGAQALARRLQSQIKSEADFASFARKNSAGASAGSGGRIGWQRLSELPEKSRAALERLAPGGMSRPVLLEDRVVIYWLSERGEDPLGKDAGPWLDYAQLLLPETGNVEAEVAAVRARVDTCDDLYTVAKGLPADRLTRQSQPQSAVGGDVGAVLATLDAGETAARISRDGWRVMLMLCSRGPSPEAVPNRDVIREQLLNQRLSSLADIYLEELRSEAIITEK